MVIEDNYFSSNLFPYFSIHASMFYIKNPSFKKVMQRSLNSTQHKNLNQKKVHSQTKPIKKVIQKLPLN